MFCHRKIHHSAGNQLYIDDFGPLRSVQAIFVWKISFDAAYILEYDFEIDERVEIVHTGFQTFRDLVAVTT